MTSRESEFNALCQRLEDEYKQRIEQLTSQFHTEFAERCEQWEDDHRVAEQRREEQWQESEKTRQNTAAQRLTTLSKQVAGGLQKLRERLE